jgi:hypothetical protein
MRLIHTSDWHLGRKLKGVDRTPEIALALEEILKYAQEFEVDAVLVAGDILMYRIPQLSQNELPMNFFISLISQVFLQWRSQEIMTLPIGLIVLRIYYLLQE